MKRLLGLLAPIGLVFTVACAQTDSGITTNVKSKFAADEVVKAYQIDVTTENQVVTLSGDVDSFAAKEQAIRIARDTEGVRDVIDQLRIEETAATSGIDDALRRGAQEVREGAEEVGDRVRDLVTDDDPDTDRDGR